MSSVELAEMSDSGPLVAIESHDAYWVLTADPPSGHPGEIVPLTRLVTEPETFLSPLRCAPDRTAEQAYSEILGLLPSMPGVPLGLTFDGGIAVTYTDYSLAEQRWKKARS